MIIEHNSWKDIWGKRNIDEKQLEEATDIFSMFKELKRADGFDTNQGENYYEEFFDEWHRMFSEIEFAMKGKKIQSAFEVGCGSGVNLYMFQKYLENVTVGGVDYSEALIKIASKVLRSSDIKCGEAIHMDCDLKYDVVISDGVFPYFPTCQYSEAVLQKMFQKANYLIIINEIHDFDKKEECIQFRRQMIDNYDKKYEGLDKTFLPQKMFYDFADKNNCDIKFTKNRNPAYWNSDFIYNCYIYKHS